MPRPRSWTDDELCAAVVASSTMAEVHRRLGLRPGRYDAMLRHMRRVGVDHDHLMVTVAGRSRPRRSKEWTDDEFRAVVARSRTISDVARVLGYVPSGGRHRWIAARIRALALDTAHFDRFAYQRSPAYRRRTPRALAEVLVRGSTARSGAVRRRLIAAGLKEARCEGCGLAEWRGESLPLQLDHINGDHTDNRLENLRILCGNCHSQTATWCSKLRVVHSE